MLRLTVLSLLAALAVALSVNFATAQIMGANLAITISAPHLSPQTLLPTSRDASANWRMAGLQSIGGIPTRNTQCGATVNPIGGGSDDTANIQAAINACAAGQFVNLGSGTFTIAEGQTVNVNKGVTLRGQGPGTTIVRHPPGADATNNACNAPGAWGATINSQCPGNNPSVVIKLGSGNPNPTVTTNLGANAAIGATTIQVASTAGFAVGGLVLVDELGNGQSMPDATFNNGTGQVWASPDYSTLWNVHSPAVNFFDSSCLGFGTCAPNNFAAAPGGGDECAYSIRCGGVHEELHMVSAIGAGPCPGASCTVTFDSPLTFPYKTANTAQARFYPTSSFTSQAGVESMTVQYGDQGNVIAQGCAYCWAKKVESLNWLNTGAFAAYQLAFRFQFERNWAHNAAWPVFGGGGYAVNLTFGASEGLITDNIVMKANKVMVCRASGSGVVTSYNYMDQSYIKGQSWAEVGLNCSHLIGSHGSLFEGNRSNNIDSDFTHGNSTYMTFFRNYITGFREAFTDIDGRTIDDRNNLPGGNGPLRCFSTHGYSYWFNFAGNVCGISGAMAGWAYQNPNFGGAPPTVLKLGWNDSATAGSGPDPSANTIYPDVPAGITAAGCTLDSANPCTTVVTGNYDYLTNAIHWDSRGPQTLPASLYLTSAPAFFSGFTYPPVVPTAGVANEIPAHARWAACQPNPTAACLMP